MALNIGRQGQAYVKLESSYATDPTIAATNALRHINLQFSTDPFARVTSPEKKVGPGPFSRFDRRTQASLQTFEGILRPSAALNTLPEPDPILEAAFGAKTNETLSTTVSASPSPTTTVFTVADVGSLVVGDAVLINIASTGLNHVRFVTGISTLELTVAPALPGAPAASDTVKGCITYSLTSALAKSLWISHYLTGFSRNLRGIGIDSLSLTFDGTEEARFSASGPAQRQVTAAESQPAGFTIVPSTGNPPTGMVGEFYLNDTVYLHKSLDIAIANGLALRNVEAGSNYATEVYRAARRAITLNLLAFVETEATLYDLTEAGTNCAIFRQNGRTEGNIVAVRAPNVEFKVGTTSDNEEATDWGFAGMALETTLDNNDELYLAFA